MTSIIEANWLAFAGALAIEARVSTFRRVTFAR